MKHRLKHSLTVAAFLAVFATGLYAAQDPAGAGVGPSESAQLQTALTGLIQDALNGKGGWVTTLLILIGGLRLLVKPVMNVMGGVVCETKINGYRTTWWFRFLEYTLDLTASVKIARPAPDDASQNAAAVDSKSQAGKEDPLK